MRTLAAARLKDDQSRCATALFAKVPRDGMLLDEVDQDSFDIASADADSRRE
jgi:hypothetical protein